VITPVFQELINQFIRYAREHPSEEVCALIYNDHLQIVPNVAPNKKTNFQISNLEMLDGYQSKTGVQALLHSHPIGSSEPSTTDRNGMMSTGCRWIIYSVIYDHLWDSEHEKRDLLWRAKKSVR